MKFFIGIFLSPPTTFTKSNLHLISLLNFFSIYLGNDTLPFKATVDNGALNFYFYYDNVGRLSKDSVIEYSTVGNNGYYYVTNFTYSNSKIFTLSVGDLSNNGHILFIKDTIQLDARGNFLSSKTYDKDPLSGNYFLCNTTYSTFDNKLSPYTKVNGYKIWILANQIPIEKPFAFTANNLLNEISNNYTTTGGVPTLYSTYQINYKTLIMQMAF